MASKVLLWFLPGGWFQVDLLAPDAGNRIAQRITDNLQREIPADRLKDLIDTELIAARHAADQGVILLATYTEGELGLGDIPAGLSLTLAVGRLPDTPSPDDRVAPAGRSPTDSPASSLVPLRLADPDIRAFTREVRREVDRGGATGLLGEFQRQVFVVPSSEDITAVVTVTTFDSAWEGRARLVAETFADTLVFLDTEGPASE